MKVLVYCSVVLWCLVVAQENRQYHLHSLPNTRTLDNDHKLDVFVQNQRDMPSQLNIGSHRPQISKFTGGIHGIHQAPLHTDQARHIIHFSQHPTHTNTEQTDKDNTGRMYKDVSLDRSQFRELAANEQTQRHNTRGFGESNGQPNGLVHLGDLKIAAQDRPNTFQIHKIVQPKVTRTVYINGVKVENDSDENVASIITALLNPHLQNQHRMISSQNEGSKYHTRGLLNGNPLDNYNQQHNAQVPSYILGHLNNYNQDSEYFTGKSNNYNKIPSIDVRMGQMDHHFGNGKLAKLREKGRYIQNATNIYTKRHVTQNNMQAGQEHRVAEDRIIFV